MVCADEIASLKPLYCVYRAEFKPGQFTYQ